MTRARAALVALALLGLFGVACGIGGPGGSAQVALAVDQADPDKPILTPVDGPIPVGQEFFVRLEVNEIVEADEVEIRILNDTGEGLQEIDFLRYPVEPPWNVAAIPVTLTQPGKWSLSLVVSSRKITDVEVETRR